MDVERGEKETERQRERGRKEARGTSFAFVEFT